MLLVIFGAGASYDSIDSKPPGSPNPGWLIDEEFRPPLAEHLFGSRSVFSAAMLNFTRIQPIIPMLRNTSGKNVETVLRELQDEAGAYPERHSQLMAVRYYLQNVLWQCGDHWKLLSRGVTNYKALLDGINRWRKPYEAVCLVTFNYDTLLEDAMQVVGLTMDDINDYVRHPIYKVFKLHGSVNWARYIETNPYATPYRDLSHIQVALDNIEHADTLRISPEYVQIRQHPCGVLNNRGLVPAIAIPVEKKDRFECPEHHLRQLEQMLPEVDKILMVGWRATEDLFLDLLGHHLKKPLSALIVTWTVAEGAAIRSRLEKGSLQGTSNRWQILPDGFTSCVVNRRTDSFLSQNLTV